MFRKVDWGKEGQCENSLELYLNGRKTVCVQPEGTEVQGYVLCCKVNIQEVIQT